MDYNLLLLLIVVYGRRPNKINYLNVLVFNVNKKNEHIIFNTKKSVLIIVKSNRFFFYEL